MYGDQGATGGIEVEAQQVYGGERDEDRLQQPSP
jgi:hypothetical protein